MIIELKQTNLKLIPVTKEYIEKKLQPLERFVRRYEEKGEIHIFVEIAQTTKHHQKGNIFYAEITLELPKSIIRAEATDIDVRAALHKVKNLVKSECRQYKERYVMEPKKNVQKG